MNKTDTPYGSREACIGRGGPPRKPLALTHPGDDVVLPGLVFIQLYGGHEDSHERRFFLYWHDPGLPERTKGTGQAGSTTRGQVFHADWRWHVRHALERGDRVLDWPSMTEFTLAQLDEEEAANAATVMVKGQDVQVGDDLWAGGRPHRVTRITPYRHSVVTRGEDWRIAHSDGPGGRGAAAWGMTLSYDHGWAARYQITIRPGEPRYENTLPQDDYPSPFYGGGADLYSRYIAEGAAVRWRDWLAGLGAA